jgi:uncharacterized protein YlaN (UPF0358 family)
LSENRKIYNLFIRDLETGRKASLWQSSLNKNKSRSVGLEREVDFLLLLLLGLEREVDFLLPLLLGLEREVDFLLPLLLGLEREVDFLLLL